MENYQQLNESGAPLDVTYVTTLDKAAKVWSALTEIFGNTLVSNFGESPPPIWREKIQLLSNEEIAQGLEKLSGADSGYAPTLGQFMAACKKTGYQRQGLQQIGYQDIQTCRYKTAMNRMLLLHVMRKTAVPPAMLKALLSYRDRVAADFRKMWGDAPNQEEMGDILLNVNREFTRITNEEAS